MALDFRTSERAYFFDNLSLIRKIYGDRRHVAICNGEIVDSELDRNALLARLRINLTGKGVCIGRAGDQLEEELFNPDSPDVVRGYNQAEGAD